LRNNSVYVDAMSCGTHVLVGRRCWVDPSIDDAVRKLEHPLTLGALGYLVNTCVDADFVGPALVSGRREQSSSHSQPLGGWCVDSLG
jgi:hypothetical protein